MASTTGTNVAQGDPEYAMRAINAPSGREALVLSEPFRQLGVANQSEGNSNNRRPEDAACDALQHFREGDQREAGPKAEDQGTQGDGHHTGRDQQTFRSHGIYEFAAGHLTYQTSDAVAVHSRAAR